jgi:hypothetical protein
MLMLNSPNYPFWKFQMVAYLKRKDLYYFIAGENYVNKVDDTRASEEMTEKLTCGRCIFLLKTCSNHKTYFT